MKAPRGRWPSAAAPDADALFVVAESQAGYFTTSQAAEAGYSRQLVAHHATAGNFARVRQGVYRLARYPGSAREDLYIAWLQAGPDAVVSHDSALDLYGLSDILPSEIHLTLPRTSSRRRTGIRMHTSPLSSIDVTSRDGLPVTTVARTIADVIRAGTSTEHVAQAIDEALERGMLTQEDLRRHAAMRGGRVAQTISTALSTTEERAETIDRVAENRHKVYYCDMKYTLDSKNHNPASLERSLGPAQARLLLVLAERFGMSFTTDQARLALPGEQPYLTKRLSELVAKGWLFSMGRGAYMIAPLEAGPESDSYAVNRYLAAATIAGDRDYYLSYRTAMELHGMTLHPWRTVYVSTASRLRTREIQHFTVKPVTVAAAHLWGATEVQVFPDHRVRVSTQARTIVDCLDRPAYAGGIQDVALGMTLLGEDLAIAEAVEAAIRYGRVSVIKRLGVLTELLAPGQAVAVEPLRSWADDTPHVLDPQTRRTGRLNARWGIWMNIPEDELLQAIDS